MIALPLLTAQKGEEFPLRALEGLEPRHLETEAVHYRGRDAIHLSATAKTRGEPMVILSNSDFENGTIELDLAGASGWGTRGWQRAGGRGFPRAEPDTVRSFYLRMTNARADDQERRNHTLQYIPAPDFPFERTRAETPARHASYADLEAGAWTRVRIVVSGEQGSGSARPHRQRPEAGKVRGKVALWSGRDADGYPSNLRIH